MNAKAARAKISSSKKTAPSVLEARPSEEKIRVRAYEIYLARNGEGGDEVADWLQAEHELNLTKG